MAEAQVRTLIEEWAAALRAGDLDGVLAGHTDDIVMFDVAPPHNGIRGMATYREAWPPFLTWIAQGAAFDILELEFTAGADVAFAHALLRCGTPDMLAAAPDTRLRLTLGLCKENGQWLIAHEHHSFPGTMETDSARAVDEIQALHQRWFAATVDKDVDLLMEEIADDIVSYEHETPLQYTGIDNVREVCLNGLVSAPGTVTWTVPDMKVTTCGDLAVVWGLNRMTHEAADGQVSQSWSRGTRVFQRRDRRWLLVHQHVSYPYNLDTGTAITDLTP